MMTVPSVSRPAPHLISASPAASASFRNIAGRPIASLASAAPSMPTQPSSTFAAVRALPRFTTVGNAKPAGPVAGSLRDNSATVRITASGVEGWGVGTDSSSLVSSPRVTSARPPLMDEPPTSMPRRIMGSPETAHPQRCRRRPSPTGCRAAARGPAAPSIYPQ